MSDSTPKKTIPQYIEPRKFSAHGAILCGEIPNVGFQRLAQALVDVERIEADFNFDIDEEKRRVVMGEIKADVSLQCQRCLESMQYHLDVNVHWAVVWDEEKARQLPSHLEPWIAGEEPEDLYAMVEEELLLALPVAPVHAELCIDGALLRSGKEPVAEATTVKNSPFQALAALKGQSKN